MAGPAWFAVLTGWRLIGRRRTHTPATRHAPGPSVAVAMTTLAVVATVLAWTTYTHNRIYATEVTFWENAATGSPHKPRVLNNLGYAYAMACRDAEAAAMFERAIALDPENTLARVNLALLRKGRLQGGQAVQCPSSGVGPPP